MEQAQYGTVEEVPYVGDSPMQHAKCKHGDYDKFFKGATKRDAEKALAAHYEAKHADD